MTQTIERQEAAPQPAQWFEADPLWFKRAVFYEIHLRGFFDGNDDGSGDFLGLTEKLDYLAWLGVDCIWLLPMAQALNEARRRHPALQHLPGLRFLDTRSDALIAYAKIHGPDVVLTVVNIDPHTTQEGLVTVPADLGLPPVFAVRDVLDGTGYDWRLGGNYVRLEPGHRQAHVLEVLQ